MRACKILYIKTSLLQFEQESMYINGLRITAVDKSG